MAYATRVTDCTQLLILKSQSFTIVENYFLVSYTFCFWNEITFQKWSLSSDISIIWSAVYYLYIWTYVLIFEMYILMISSGINAVLIRGVTVDILIQYCSNVLFKALECCTCQLITKLGEYYCSEEIMYSDCNKFYIFRDWVGIIDLNCSMLCPNCFLKSLWGSVIILF